MPTNTFFHLPEEKQQRLLDAAQIEFSRHSLQEASIANIVKLAEIPRGSFYQYFENKNDCRSANWRECFFLSEFICQHGLSCFTSGDG